MSNDELVLGLQLLALATLGFVGLGIFCVQRRGRGGTLVSATDDDDDDDDDDDEEEDDEDEQKRGGKTKKDSNALVVATRAAPSNRAPVKAYVEIGGDVHTIRVSAGGIGSAAELRGLLGDACASSGAPELKSVDLGSAEIQVRHARPAPAPTLSKSLWFLFATSNI